MNILSAKSNMNQGKYVFVQLMELISRYEFDKCVSRYKGNSNLVHFKCRQQFLCMAFGQLAYRESIRDIFICLNAHKKKVYHLGLKNLADHTTLTRANKNRDWRIWSDLANYLISITRPMYIEDNDFTLDLDNTVYALDASTIDLCLSIFTWAKFRKKKGAVKLHTLMDLRGNIPVFIDITDGKVHDVKVLDKINFEPDAFYVIDKGYYDFTRLFKMNTCSSFFVIRAKKNLRCRRIYSSKVDKSTGLKYDQVIKLTNYKSQKDYPDKLRRIKYYDV